MATPLIPPGWEIEDSPQVPPIPDGFEIEDSPKPKATAASKPADPMNATMSARKPGFIEQITAPIREGAIGRAFGLSTETAEARKEDPSNPILRFESALPNQKPGIVRGAAKFASGMTTPENALIMAATGGVGRLAAQIGKTGVAKLVSMGFSADMVNKAAEQSPQFVEHVKAGDWGAAAETLTQIGLTAGMAALGLKHGMAADVKPAEGTPTQIRDAQRPYVEPAPPGPPGPKMNRQQRRASVAVPETGVPENVARAQGEREDIIGKPRQQWTNEDVIAADQLRAEGYTGAKVPEGWEVEQKKPTSAKPTVPETPNTMKAQLGQLTAGERRAVMFPKGTPLAKRPAGMKSYQDADGNVYVFNPKLTSQPEIDAAIANNRLPDLLGAAEGGMGAPDKTALAGEPVAVVGRGPDGTTTQATAADQASLPKAVRQTEKLTPEGGTVSVEPPEVEIAKRTAIKSNVNPAEMERSGPLNVSRINEGEPGIVIERDRDLSRMRRVVYRDENGKPQGYLSFYLDDAEAAVAPKDHGLFPEVWVNPKFRRQGIATKLYDAAEKAGFDLSDVSGSETTPSGAAFLNDRREGLLHHGTSSADRAAIDRLGLVPGTFFSPSHEYALQAARARARFVGGEPSVISVRRGSGQWESSGGDQSGAFYKSKGLIRPDTFEKESARTAIPSGWEVVESKPLAEGSKKYEPVQNSVQKEPWQMSRVEWLQTYPERTRVAVRAEVERKISDLTKQIEMGRGMLESDPNNPANGAIRAGIPATEAQIAEQQARLTAPIKSPEETWTPAQIQWHHVEGALREGKPVPPEVLADYPNLSAKPTPSKAKATTFGSERGSLSLKPLPEPTTPGELYAKEMIAKREAARRGPLANLATRVKQAVAKVKAEGVDSTAPILDALKQAQKRHGYEVRPSQNIEYNIDRAYRATSLAEQFVKDNGLDRLIRDVEDVDYLDQYLIAKHAKGVEALKGEENRVVTGRDLARDQQLIDEFRNRVAIPAADGRPAMTYDQAARAISQYSQKVLDYSVDAGLVPKDLATHLKSIYPDYVPLNRVFAAVEQGTFGGPSTRAVASLSKQTVVQMLEGSQREIENPLWSMLDKTRKAFEQGERNKAAAQLAGYRDLPGFEGLIQEIQEGKGAPQNTTFSYLDNGKKRSFQTTPEIAAAAKSLDVHSIGLLGKIFGAPGRLMKLGTTGINLPFIASNVVADQAHTLVTSRYDKSLANPGVFFKAMMAALKHDELWSEVVREGAGFTSFDQFRDQPASTMRSIRGSKDVRGGKAVLRYLTIDKPAQLFRQAEDIVSRSEEFGRARVYAQTKARLLKEGRTEADAKILAALEANNSLPNYMRAGAMMRPLNAVIPYLNAGVQGSRSFLRSMERNPVKTAASVATTLYFPVAMATLWNLSDPERQKAYRDIQKHELDNNLVILMPHPSKDRQNRYDVLKFKLPPGLNQLTVPLRRAIEAAAGLDPVKFGELAQAAVGSVSPVEPNPRSLGSTLIPQALKPTVQAVANYDFFRDKPKVPGRLQDLPPEMQELPYTSGTAKLIGKKLGISPIKTEEFVKDTLGGIGSQVLNASDQALYRAGRIPKSDIGGTSTAEAIGARFSKARGGEIENREFELKQKITQDMERKAVDAARKTPYYQRLSGNEEMAQRYLNSVAARARNQVLQVTSSPRYRRMETEQKLVELGKLKARLEGNAPPTRLYRPIPTPIAPPSQRSRYDLSPPGPIN